MTNQIVGLSGESFNEADVMPWEKVEPAYFWDEYGSYVIADRHLPDGTRQHMVDGYVAPGTVCANAHVIGNVNVG